MALMPVDLAAIDEKLRGKAPSKRLRDRAGRRARPSGLPASTATTWRNASAVRPAAP